MMWRPALVALMPFAALSAEPPPQLNGTWGTKDQCAGATLLKGGTKTAEPFVITQGWLQHGALFCRLAFFAPQHRAGGIYAAARAQCGEDSVQSYWLVFDLAGEDLTLIWDETLVNGPLNRCSASGAKN